MVLQFNCRGFLCFSAYFLLCLFQNVNRFMEPFKNQSLIHNSLLGAKIALLFVGNKTTVIMLFILSECQLW